MMRHINSISCGQGAPSLFLIVMAGEGMFQADVVIVADTGWENDLMRNDGRPTTAREFFEEVTKPLANSYGIDAVFVRTLKEDGNPYPALHDAQMRISPENGNPQIDIPLFGSKGGKLSQTCTSKWKIQGIRQELRRRGAKTATTALGIHRQEIHRLKPSQVAWDKYAWPLVDLMQTRDGGSVGMGINKTWNRSGIELEMERRSIPYLVTTECDGCPHKNYERWKRTSPGTIEELAVFEAQFGGDFFLTSYRIPLKKALALMKSDNDNGASLFDGCDSGYCFV